MPHGGNLTPEKKPFQMAGGMDERAWNGHRHGT